MWGRMLLGVATGLAAIWIVTHGPPGAASAATPAPSIALPHAERPPPLAAGGLVEAPARDLVAPAAPARSHATPSDPEQGPPSPRSVRVVDAAGLPVGGVVIGTDTYYDADGRVCHDGAHTVTGGDGRAVLAVRTGKLVSFCAPGFCLSHDYAPAPADDWTVVLPRALRLEMSVLGTADFAGLNLRVELPPDCPDGPFYQSQYVQTPGRAVDGTVARWTFEPAPRADRRWRRLSVWATCVPPTGTAVLDQIEGAGTVTVQLRRFGQTLDERRFAIEDQRGPVRMQFTITPTTTLRGIVVDELDRPLPDALLRMAPFGDRRIVDSPTDIEAFPVWAPATRTDGGGRFVLPRADSGDERIVVTCPGHAARVVTVAEVETAGNRIALSAGRTVRIEILDCNGKPLDGGDSTGGHQYAEPSVLLDHDVWRGTSDRELPWFEFAELPPTTVTFRCAGEELRHDARVPYARLITPGPVELMGIGK